MKSTVKLLLLVAFFSATKINTADMEGIFGNDGYVEKIAEYKVNFNQLKGIRGDAYRAKVLAKNANTIIDFIEKKAKKEIDRLTYLRAYLTFEHFYKDDPGKAPQINLNDGIKIQRQKLALEEAQASKKIVSGIPVIPITPPGVPGTGPGIVILSAGSKIPDVSIGDILNELNKVSDANIKKQATGIIDKNLKKLQMLAAQDPVTFKSKIIQDSMKKVNFYLNEVLKGVNNNSLDKNEAKKKLTELNRIIELLLLLENQKEITKVTNEVKQSTGKLNSLVKQLYDINKKLAAGKTLSDAEKNTKIEEEKIKQEIAKYNQKLSDLVALVKPLNIQMNTLFNLFEKKEEQRIGPSKKEDKDIKPIEALKKNIGILNAQKINTYKAFFGEKNKEAFENFKKDLAKLNEFADKLEKEEGKINISDFKDKLDLLNKFRSIFELITGKEGADAKSSIQPDVSMISKYIKLVGLEKNPLLIKYEDFFDNDKGPFFYKQLTGKDYIYPSKIPKPPVSPVLPAAPASPVSVSSTSSTAAPATPPAAPAPEGGGIPAAPPLEVTVDESGVPIAPPLEP